MAAVPNLQEKQAERLLRNSYLENKSSEEAHVSLVDTFQIVREMALEQKNMKQHINFIDKVVSFVADSVRPRERATGNGVTSKVGVGNVRLENGEDIPPWAQELQKNQREIIAMQKQMAQYMGTQFKNLASKHDSLAKELGALRTQAETNTSQISQLYAQTQQMQVSMKRGGNIKGLVDPQLGPSRAEGCAGCSVSAPES